LMASSVVRSLVSPFRDHTKSQARRIVEGRFF
jgi:hypothetical protein